MFVEGHAISATYALGAVCTWGFSDFIGGYTARRFDSFLLASLTHLSGTIVVATLALIAAGPFPPLAQIGWALAAGACGGLSLALFYHALAQGNMGLAAPVAALLSALLPASFGILTQGAPGLRPSAGLLLALLAIWLISRPEGGLRPRGLGLAVVAGFGFALFYIFMERAGRGAALWLAAASRFSSLIFTGAITLAAGRFSPVYRLGFVWGFLAGAIDVTGTVLFVRAAQTGPLARAVILSSLYPLITVLLARLFLGEHFTRSRAAGVIAALAAIPMLMAA
ncbi:MAG: DMT family transporter [Acidobacteria bacterium]|nr:DMT family transporter [Acidobacteriota bacterium]